MSNPFEQYLAALENKIVHQAFPIEGGIQIIFTDNTTLTLVACEDIDIEIVEVQPLREGADKFSVSYSPKRGEVYVMDRIGNVKFTLSEDDTLVDVAELTNDKLFSWVLDTHYQELEAFGLV